MTGEETGMPQTPRSRISVKRVCQPRKEVCPKSSLYERRLKQGQDEYPQTPVIIFRSIRDVARRRSINEENRVEI